MKKIVVSSASVSGANVGKPITITVPGGQGDKPNTFTAAARPSGQAVIGSVPATGQVINLVKIPQTHSMSTQVCCKDLWYAEVLHPRQTHLVGAKTEELDICWPAVPTAEAYRIQLQRCEKTSKWSMPSYLPVPVRSPPQPVSSPTNSPPSQANKMSLQKDNISCKAAAMLNSPVMSSPLNIPREKSLNVELEDAEADLLPSNKITPSKLTASAQPTSVTGITLVNQIKPQVGVISTPTTKSSLASMLAGIKLPLCSSKMPDLVSSTPAVASSTTKTVPTLSTLPVQSAPITSPKMTVLPPTRLAPQPQNGARVVATVASPARTIIPVVQQYSPGIRAVPQGTLIRGVSPVQGKQIILQKSPNSTGSNLVTFVKTSQGVTVAMPKTCVVQAKPGTAGQKTIPAATIVKLLSGNQGTAPNVGAMKMILVSAASVSGGNVGKPITITVPGGQGGRLKTVTIAARPSGQAVIGSVPATGQTIRSVQPSQTRIVSTQGPVVTQRLGARSPIQILKVNGGVNLSWDPPPNEVIIEYSVYLAIRSATYQVWGENKTVLSTSTRLAFIRVYCGPNNSCRIEPHQIAEAYIDKNTKPSIIFRIVARNERGCGPAAQVRWLQDTTTQSKPAF